MYFITVLENVEANDMYMAEFGDFRTWGYYSEYDRAATAVRANVTDLHEDCYEYAVIEKIGCDLCPIVEERQWFKWDKDKHMYFEIEEPESVKRITNFAIG